MKTAQGYPYWYTREELNESVSGPIVGMNDYIKAIGYYMNLCKNYSLFSESITMPFDQKKVAIKGSSDRIAGIIAALADAIIREKAENKTELYDAYKTAAARVSFGNETLDLLEKELKREGFRE